MNCWPHEMVSTNMDEILETVNDDAWQKFRRSLKGIPTTQKLIKLQGYLLSEVDTDRKRVVRVTNYINALKRGGQLTMDLKVQR